MLAAANGAEDCVIILLKNGADVEMKDSSDLDAKDWAIKNSHKRYVAKYIDLKNTSGDWSKFFLLSYPTPMCI